MHYFLPAEAKGYHGFTHDDSDGNIVAYMLQADELGKDWIQNSIDETYVFVMLVYWVWKCKWIVMCRWNVGME